MDQPSRIFWTGGQVAPPDGTPPTPTTPVTQCLANNVCTSYKDNATIVTDQAGKMRRTVTDVLGRLVEVGEPGVVAGHTTNNYATMQSDGNFVVYNPANVPLWNTGTAGTGASPLEVQDDGNLVLYQFKWQAGTYRPWNGGVVPYDGCRISDSLFAGQTLLQGQCLENTTNTTFALMDNGNLEIYDRQLGQITFQSFTWGNTSARLVMQSDGNLVIYSVNNIALWASGTNGSGANVATLENDGRLILYSTVWSSGTTQAPVAGNLVHPACDLGVALGTTGMMGTGQCFVSRNGHYQLLLQTDGNLVLSDIGANPARTLWSANTGLTPVSPGVAMQTLYSYNVLGNLLCVEQHGDAATGTGCSAAPSNDATSPWRVRRFTYDSLSRLLTAKNPESGTISYAYDNDGNLLQKISPAPNQTNPAVTQTISYCYDELHRVTMKDYQPHTYAPPACPITAPVVSYIYDQGTNAKGKLVHLADQAGTADYSYDALGRTTTEQRTTAGISKSIGYAYNLDASLKQLTYPSGRIVNYAPDSAGRLISAIDGNGTNYISAASYNAPGALTGMTNNGAVTSSFFYNPRLQLCRITAWTSGSVPTSCIDPAVHGNLMDRGYNFNLGAGDNGNVISITNYRDSSRSQAFTYDSLNRITAGWTSANTGTLSWGENYTIDAWGNLMISHMSGQANGGNFQCASDNNNRATCLGYDAAGNISANGSAAYTFDQENRLSSTAGTNYIYDADGNRVKKSSGSTGTLYWYASPGVIAETDLTGTLKSEYVFFGAKRVARIDSPGNSVHYYLSDHLNSTSMVVGAGGAPEEESDYSPFGNEYQVSSTGTNHYKFTGKEQDSESGLDLMGVRYYSSSTGRFTKPDPLMIQKQKLFDPQQWDMYQYARNNPLRYRDPSGLYVCADSAKCDSKQDKAFEKARQNDLKSKDPNVVRGAQSYGDPTKDNGTTVKFGDTGKHNGLTSTGSLRPDPEHPGQFQAVTTVTIKSGLSGTALDAAVGHEGTHVADAQAFAATVSADLMHYDYSKNLTKYQTEVNAYRVTQAIQAAANEKASYGEGCTGGQCIFGPGVTSVDQVINQLLAAPANGYSLTPDNQGTHPFPDVPPPPKN